MVYGVKKLRDSAPDERDKEVINDTGLKNDQLNFWGSYSFLGIFEVISPSVVICLLTLFMPSKTFGNRD